MRSQLLVKCLLGNIPAEVEAAESNVKYDPALFGIANDWQNLAVFIKDRGAVVVIEVGNDVALLRDVENLVDRRVFGLHLKLTNMRIKR